jgi:hypothetical protein
LSKTSKELELLLQDVRLHPTRYVNVSLFGKKEKTYKAPVADTISKKKTSDYNLDNILFALLLVIGFSYFSQFKKNKRNINLGIDVDRKDNPGARKKHGHDSAGTVKMVKDA